MRRSITTTSGRVPLDLLDGLRAVVGLADHTDAGQRVQQHGQAAAHHDVVVGEHDPDGRARGRRASRS